MTRTKRVRERFLVAAACGWFIGSVLGSLVTPRTYGIFYGGWIAVGAALIGTAVFSAGETHARRSREPMQDQGTTTPQVELRIVPKAVSR